MILYSLLCRLILGVILFCLSVCLSVFLAVRLFAVCLSVFLSACLYLTTDRPRLSLFLSISLKKEIFIIFLLQVLEHRSQPPENWSDVSHLNSSIFKPLLICVCVLQILLLVKVNNLEIYQFQSKRHPTKKFSGLVASYCITVSLILNYVAVNGSINIT